MFFVFVIPFYSDCLSKIATFSLLNLIVSFATSFCCLFICNQIVHLDFQDAKKLTWSSSWWIIRIRTEFLKTYLFIIINISLFLLTFFITNTCYFFKIFGFRYKNPRRIIIFGIKNIFAFLHIPFRKVILFAFQFLFFQRTLSSSNFIWNIVPIMFFRYHI